MANADPFRYYGLGDPPDTALIDGNQAPVGNETIETHTTWYVDAPNGAGTVTLRFGQESRYYEVPFPTDGGQLRVN